MYVKGQPFIPQFIDPSTGSLMASGTVEFYLYDTVTPTPYYTNSTGTSGGTSLTLGSGGKPSTDIFFDSDIVYKIVVKNAAGTTLDTIKPYYPVGGGVRAPKCMTMQEAIADATLMEGDVLIISDRANSLWDVVLSSSVTENGYNIVQGVGVATVSFVLRIVNSVYNPVAFGAPVDNSEDAYGAIAAMISAANTAHDTGLTYVTFDFGSQKYKSSQQITIDGFNYMTLKGNFRITSTHSDDCVLRVANSAFITIIGEPQIYGAGGSTYANRTNLFGVIFHNCSKVVGQGLNVYSTLCDATRFTGTSAMPTFSYLRSQYCGSGRVDGSYVTLSAPVATFTAPVQSGSTNSANQRSTLTMSSVPQALKDYIDYGLSEGGSAAYIRVNGNLHMIQSYSGSDIVVWPWVDPADAGADTQYIFGAGAYFLGGDVSCPDIQLLDAIQTGIGVAGNSLYPPKIGTAVIQACGIAVLQGASNSAASEEFLIGKLYVELNDVDILMSSQANTPLTILQIVAPDYSKIKQLWSNNGAGVQVRDQLTELVLGSHGRLYKDQYPFQLATSNQVSLRIYDDRPLTIASDTAAVLLVDDDDRYAVFGQRNNFVYWYANTNGMTPTGSITFTPPSGGTINGKAPDATQVFNTATGPQHFIVSRSAALTYFIESVSPSTVTKV